jgi:hypothetical protein
VAVIYLVVAILAVPMALLGLCAWDSYGDYRISPAIGSVNGEGPTQLLASPSAPVATPEPNSLWYMVTGISAWLVHKAMQRRKAS